MSKVLGMLVALAIFAAVPAVAFGQGTSPSGGGGTVSSGNTQTGTLNQSASAGDGGNAGNQGAIVQQNAGRDANASVNQTQNFSSGGVSSTSRGYGVRGYGMRGYNNGYMSGYGTTGYGTSTRSVGLAYTGFDAWIVALLGGAALLGGSGLLVMQRRGRLSA